MIFFLKDIGGDLSSAEGVRGAITKAARSLFYTLNELVYKTIKDLYTLFEYICNSRLLDNETFQALASKVGMVLGIVMLFNVIFNFIQILLDPDRMDNKETGAVAIVKKCILVIVMLGVSNYFFETLFYIQKFIIDEKVIYKIILPSDQVPDTDNFGSVLAARTFGTFYNVNETFLNSGSSEDADTCDQYRNLLLNRIALNNDFSVGNYCLNAWDEVGVPSADGKTTKTVSAFVMDYNFIVQLLVGIALVYLLFMYVIKVGVRVIHLTVLQIISPMAIIAYLSPKKDNMFSKWWQNYFSTYIDVFIRIAIIYFVVYLSSILLDSMESGASTFWNSVGDPTDTYTRGIFTITMILALLTFAKKAPDLMKELIPASTSKLGFGLSSPKAFLKDLTSSPLTAPMKVAAAPIGLLAKKTLGGIDSVAAGQGFSKGWGNVHGKFGTWVNKQRETYMPYGTEKRKQRTEGNKEVTDINNKWTSGVNIAKKLINAGAGKAGTGANAWDKVLNGESRNKKYYDAIFKNQAFVRSKMEVDKESNVEDELRRLQQRVNLEGAASTFGSGAITIGGKTYTDANVGDLIEDLEKQQKKVEGLKGVHESMRKQHQSDAQVEDQFKFIKNNETNPANPANTHSNRGIR